MMSHLQHGHLRGMFEGWPTLHGLVAHMILSGQSCILSICRHSRLQLMTAQFQGTQFVFARHCCAALEGHPGCTQLETRRIGSVQVHKLILYPFQTVPDWLVHEDEQELVLSLLP